MRKPKPMKGVKVIYDDKVYENVISFSRGYEWGSFSYLDDSGAECSVYLNSGKAFQIIDNNK